MDTKETKQHILDTALTMFQAGGYEGVTVNDICEACSITKTTFYYHLDSKEDIINSIYYNYSRALPSRLVDVLRAGTFWEQLMVIFYSMFDVPDALGFDLYRQLYAINIRSETGIFGFDEDMTRMAVLIIERGQKAGEIRNQSPPETLYRTACVTFSGIEVGWLIKGGKFNRKRHLRMLLENIFDVIPEYRTKAVDADFEMRWGAMYEDEENIS